MSKELFCRRCNRSVAVETPKGYLVENLILRSLYGWCECGLYLMLDSRDGTKEGILSEEESRFFGLLHE
jgi:hypothetical protein